MRIVGLNLCHGGGKRIARLLEWLLKQNADVLVLSEWRYNKGGHALVSLLTSSGFAIHQQAKSGGANGLLLAVRGECSFTPATPVGSERGELAVVDLPLGLTVVGAYFPQSYAQRAFFDACRILANRASGALLIVGDMNTGCNVRDKPTLGTPFHCSKDFVELSETAGLTDLWRRSHGNEAQEWTWRSPKNGFRIDHAFGNPQLLRDHPHSHCQYDHFPREIGISDHSAIVVTL